MRDLLHYCRSIQTAGLLVFLFQLGSFGQPVVAPTPQQAGSPRGDTVGDYNITNSWEVGYRFHSVDGNIGKYRSDVNMGNGIRLLGGEAEPIPR